MWSFSPNIKNVGFSKSYLSSESLIIPIMCLRNRTLVRLSFLQDEWKILWQNFYLGLFVKCFFFTWGEFLFWWMKRVFGKYLFHSPRNKKIISKCTCTRKHFFLSNLQYSYNVDSNIAHCWDSHNQNFQLTFKLSTYRKDYKAVTKLTNYIYWCKPV